MTLHCGARRQPDGSWGCLACKRTWGAGEDYESFCEAKAEAPGTGPLSLVDHIAVKVNEGVPLVIGVDLSRGEDMTVLSYPPNSYPSLLEFALLFYDVQPYQQQLLKMLDRELPRGDKIRRRTNR